MTRLRYYTAQVAYYEHNSATVTVRARNLSEAANLAINEANDRADAWSRSDHITDSFIDAITTGKDADPWTDPQPVPLNVADPYDRIADLEAENASLRLALEQLQAEARP